MKVIHTIFCAAAVLVLAGCASGSQESAGFTSEPLIDGNRLERHSLLRAGNEAAFSTQQGRLSSNFAVSCDSVKAWLLFTSSGERRYPGGGKRYGERRELKEETARQLKAIPAVQGACQTAPDWREVRRSSDGIVTLIDVKSIERAEDDFIFWGAFDYPKIGFDPPYGAPFGQKFERFSLSCAERSYLQLSGYDVDNRNRVTDGLLFNIRAPRAAIGSDINEDYKALFAAVCGDAANWGKLPAFAVRKKEATDDPATVQQAPAAAVLQAIAQLEIQRAPRTLKRLVLAGTHTFEGRTKPSREAHLLSALPSPGLMSETVKLTDYTRTGITFLGLFGLSAETAFALHERKSRFLTTEASFSGDWSRMPVGSQIAFSVATQYASAVASLGVSESKYTTQCQVIAEMAAITLHPALAGKAKQLECRVVNDKYKQVQTAYYLQDYGHVVRTESSKTAFSYYSRRITEVEQ
ncbi:MULTISPECIES: hypothetical protein [unclassified Variovorax]|uniref:hypothetical protein n=1 Tax=unclassified Variovorax TaxID=663243 RepID=UPI003ECE3139